MHLTIVVKTCNLLPALQLLSDEVLYGEIPYSESCTISLLYTVSPVHWYVTVWWLAIFNVKFLLLHVRGDIVICAVYNIYLYDDTMLFSVMRLEAWCWWCHGVRGVP